MSGKKKCRCSKRHFCLNEILTIIFISLGIGMLVAVFIPFWVWIIIAAAALLGYGCWRYCNDK